MPEPIALTIDPSSGSMTNATGRYEKRVRDLAGVFADADAYAAALADDPDRVLYEVYDHRAQERAGGLIFGTSILHPGTIGREYNLTRRSVRPVISKVTGRLWPASTNALPG